MDIHVDIHNIAHHNIAHYGTEMAYEYDSTSPANSTHLRRNFCVDRFAVGQSRSAFNHSRQFSVCKMCGSCYCVMSLWCGAHSATYLYRCTFRVLLCCGGNVRAVHQSEEGTQHGATYLGAQSGCHCGGCGGVRAVHQGEEGTPHGATYI